jgi:hypothetical protein
MGWALMWSMGLSQDGWHKCIWQVSKHRKERLADLLDGGCTSAICALLTLVREGRRAE